MKSLDARLGLNRLIPYFAAPLAVFQLSGCLLMLVVEPTGSSGSAASSANACSSIVSIWDGDKISGLTAQDAITGSSANDGTMDASITLPAGRIGNAFTLNGTAGKVTIPDANSLDLTTGFTLAAWVNGTSESRASPKLQTILSKWNRGATAFSNSSVWTGIQTESASILNSSDFGGFSGAVFDGRYIYFVPRSLGMGNNPNVVRYDTQGSYSAATSWSGVNINTFTATSDSDYSAFSGAVYDGRYIYFVPQGTLSARSKMARFDTQGSFTADASWAGVDVAGSNALNDASYGNFEGGVFDGRYLYLIPSSWFGGTNAKIARYDTQGGFSSPASWSGVDVTSASAMNSTNYRGFSGGVFDGRYLYLVPRSNSTSYNGYLARYDTQGGLTTPASWTGVDISGASALNSASYRGFGGAVFDGRYIYFAPQWDGSAYHGNAARYDTSGSLTAPASWTGVNIAGASAINDANYKGYSNPVFDGRYVYFVPFTDTGGLWHGRVARFDTTGSFTSAANWSGADIASAGVLNDSSFKGYFSAVFDGRYLYFIKVAGTVGDQGFIPRYDTLESNASYTLNFSSASTGYGNSLPGLSFLLNTTGGALSVSAQTSISASTWHHVAATYDNTNLKLYIDGALVASRAGSGAALNSNANLLIGASGIGTGYFGGSIDEVEIFSSALSASQISALFSTTAPGFCKP